ncbi:hypothetical protein [Devosia ginsengisoli]|uniref:hypothetical protein n=1 Tax=Devosia ginsengisoli TaxID=400770 RepID=UPI0026EDA1CA|nr:hypothetical protein [Devosia ginsengisoli]MCR6670127.1 hypothetical protein [Devosia ginsengisoli]
MAPTRTAIAALGYPGIAGFAGIYVCSISSGATTAAANTDGISVSLAAAATRATRNGSASQNLDRSARYAVGAAAAAACTNLADAIRTVLAICARSRPRSAAGATWLAPAAVAAIAAIGRGAPAAAARTVPE